MLLLPFLLDNFEKVHCYSKVLLRYDLGIIIVSLTLSALSAPQGLVWNCSLRVVIAYSSGAFNALTTICRAHTERASFSRLCCCGSR